MTYYTAPGIPKQHTKSWDNIPQDVIDMYQQDTERLFKQTLDIVQRKAQEARIYNSCFSRFGFHKPVFN